MRATPWRLGLVSLAVLLTGLNAGAEDAIPFPAALDAAAVTVDRLDRVLDYALLIGNGDLNALVYTDRGQLKELQNTCLPYERLCSVKVSLMLIAMRGPVPWI